MDRREAGIGVNQVISRSGQIDEAVQSHGRRLTRQVQRLPDVRFKGRPGAGQSPHDDTIQLVDRQVTPETAGELQPQQSQRASGQ